MQVMARNKQAGVRNVKDNDDTSVAIKDLPEHGDMRTFAKIIARDLNNNRTMLRPSEFRRYGYWHHFKKDDIARFLSDPIRFENELRLAVRYVYAASSHFRRLIKYFVGLTDLAYVVMPYKIDVKTINDRITNNHYRKVLNLLSSMSIKTQFPKILTVCFREDIFYGTFWETSDSILIQQLPSRYCKISEIEDNVFNVTFDFSYFDLRGGGLLEFYPDEFRIKYEQYRSDKEHKRWITLDSPNSFAVKCNSDMMEKILPPFAGLLREIYDIEDYKDLKLSKTALENYAMIAMKIPLTEEGEWGIDLDKARGFWENLDGVLPEEVGSVLTPMDLEKISFEKSNTGDVDTIAEAEQNLFTAAGVSSLLFNNAKASANALLLSIKADQALTFELVKSLQDVVNRFVQHHSYGKNFKVSFLDCSPYNRKELGDAYLKAASYGLPTISMYAASQGLQQEELDNMSYLETTIMKLQDMFVPLISSTQISSSDLESNAATDEGGAPQKEAGELTDSGEQSRERQGED